MENNKELKIAIAVGIIMITICIIIFIFYASGKESTENIELSVYKLYLKDDAESSDSDDISASDYEYRECSATTDDILTIYSDYKKIKKLTDSDRVTGKTIVGNYKIVFKDTEYIAFDIDEENNTQYVYRSDTEHLYEYNSTIFDYISNLCE